MKIESEHIKNLFSKLQSRCEFHRFEQNMFLRENVNINVNINDLKDLIFF